MGCVAGFWSFDREEVRFPASKVALDASGLGIPVRRTRLMRDDLLKELPYLKSCLEHFSGLRKLFLNTQLIGFTCRRQTLPPSYGSFVEFGSFPSCFSQFGSLPGRGEQTAFVLSLRVVHVGQQQPIESQ